jgi:hypothetical protein
MTNHFGNRVIGHQKAAENAEAVATRSSHFGTRVIGDVLAKRRLQERGDDGARDSRSDPATKKAKGQKPQEEATTATTATEAVELPTTTNLEELKDALDGNEAFYEGLYTNELIRPSGPRKAALRLFLKFEMEHEDREDRKTEIEAALK